MDGGVRHRQHQPGDEGERGALPAGHLRGDGGEDVVVKFDDAGLDLFLVRAGVAGETVVAGIEHVQRRRVFHVLGIDDDEFVGEFVGEQLQPFDLAQHLALAVDDDERGRLFAFQVGEDEPLQQLRLAVAGAADDVHVLVALRVGEGERDRGLEQRLQRRAGEVGRDDLARRALVLVGRNQVAAGAAAVGGGSLVEIAVDGGP